MAGIADKIYAKLPVIGQHAMVTLYGVGWYQLRFGGDAKQITDGYRQRERYTGDQWAAYQQERLRYILSLAFERVPFYRDHWRGIVTADQLKKFTVRDLESLPPLEKGDVRDHPESFLLDGVKQPKHKVHHTSGSTGTPVANYFLTDERRHALAVREARSCAFAGVSYFVPRATFSGRMVEPNPNSAGPYHRFNAIERQVYFSAFHLSPRTVKQYVEALRRHKVVWITGYSNSIYQMAQLALDQGLDVPPIKAVITTSEKITDEMRAIVEKALHTRVYEEYGTVENLFYACENEYGQKLVQPDFGILEIVDSSFKSVPTGEYGEVLATGLQRYSQPMIRYRVGDIAAFSDETPKCGREMPVLAEVLGRVEDTVYGLDGRRMVRFHGIFVDQPHIQEGQIIQERLNHIRVRVVPKPGYGEADVQDIVARIQNRLTDQMKVTVEAVERIERTARGKFKAVVSQLPPEDLEKVAALNAERQN